MNIFVVIAVVVFALVMLAGPLSAVFDFIMELIAGIVGVVDGISDGVRGIKDSAKKAGEDQKRKEETARREKQDKEEQAQRDAERSRLHDFTDADALPDNPKLLLEMYRAYLKEGDKTRAFLCAEHGANLNDPDLTGLLAWCLYSGIGTQTDVEKARELQQKCFAAQEEPDIRWWADWWMGKEAFPDLAAMHSCAAALVSKGSAIGLACLEDVILAEVNGLTPIGATPEQQKEFYGNLLQNGRNHYALYHMYLLTGDRALLDEAMEQNDYFAARELYSLIKVEPIYQDRLDKNTLAQLEDAARAAALETDANMRIFEQATAAYENATTEDERAAAKEELEKIIAAGSQKADRWLLDHETERGDAAALYRMGCCCISGDLGVEKNQQRTAMLWMRAAEKGNVDAQLALGASLMDGKNGMQKDTPEALRYYEYAADAGNVEALYTLGAYYAEDGKKNALDYLLPIVQLPLNTEHEELCCKASLLILKKYPCFLHTDVYDGMEPAIYAAWHLAYKNLGNRLPACTLTEADAAQRAVEAYRTNLNSPSDETGNVYKALCLNELRLRLEHKTDTIKCCREIANCYCGLENTPMENRWLLKALKLGDQTVLIYRAANYERFGIDEIDAYALLATLAKVGGDLMEPAKEAYQTLSDKIYERDERQASARGRTEADEREARHRAEAELDDAERSANAILNGEFLTEQERVLTGRISEAEYAKSSFLRDSAMEKKLNND